MSKSINVRPLSGFRDFGQREQAQRRWLIETALSAYAQFGYLSIETPALEREEILQGQYGEDADTLRYKFDHFGSRIGLRYDHTVPFARFVASKLPKGEIGLPFRRSVVGPVWRAEKAQKGRYREFYQGDYDIAGSSSPTADAEVVLVAETVMQRLGVDYRIRINHRGLLDGILRSVQVPVEKAKLTLTVVDKLDKSGPDRVRDELRDRLELSQTQIDDALSMLQAQFDPKALYKCLDAEGRDALENIKTIEEFAKLASAFSDRIIVDLSVARGLMYYNAFVIETKIVGAEIVGAVIGGGRFDNTIGTFMDRQIPAVGASLGIDRCLDALAAVKKLPEEAALCDVAISTFPTFERYMFGIAQALRQRSLSVVFPPEVAELRAQVGYAQKNARFVLIYGEAECDGGYFSLKDFKTNEQHRLNLEEVIKKIKGA